MNISLDWYDSDCTLLYMRLEGAWDIGLSRHAIEDYKHRVREVPHRVDLVAQALDRRAMNPPPWVLRLGVNGILDAPANAGLIVLVPNSTMMLALADAGIRLLGDRYAGRIYTAADFDEAKQLIHTLRKN